MPDCALLAVLAWTLAANAAAAPAVSYRIETVAGSGANGDGGAATAAQIGAIQGIAIDRSGNLYLSDTDNHRVRRVDRSGVITTIGGTGTGGFSGDGGPATAAQFNLPYGIAVDSAGAVYVADLGNNRVRRIGPDGTVTTVAGTGAKGSAGDGGPAAAAQLFTPRNVAVDAAGNLYISEFEGHRVRRVSTDGKIATFAGTGAAGYSGDGSSAGNASLAYPAGLAVDSSGSLYIADSQNSCVRKVLTNGIISTVAGALAGMASPHAVAVDASGSIYVADNSSTMVFAYTAAGARTLYAGGPASGFQGDGGPATKAILANVLDVATDSTGSVYLADSVRVRKIDPSATIQTIAGDGYYHSVGDAGSATAALLNQPAGVALDFAGDLLIADTGTQRIRLVSPTQTITTLAGTGLAVQAIPPGSTPAVSAGLDSPTGVAADAAGNVLIADSYNHRIASVGADRNLLTLAGTGQPGMGADGLPPSQTALRGPRGVCVDRAGAVFIADTSNHRVLKVSSSAMTTVAGNGTAGDAGDGALARAAQLNQPSACALDSFGNLYIADTFSNRIRKVAPTGIITTVAGTGEAGSSGDEGAATSARIRTPRGVAVDDNGNIFLADTGNNRLRQVTADGVIHTIAGQDTAGFAGDTGPAAAALLNAPQGLALDGSGALYVADTGNNRVRRLVPGAAGVAAPVTGPTELSLENAASLHQGPVAPGEVIVISGTGLGPAATVQSPTDSGRLPTVLSGVEVQFDGADAPIFSAQASQVMVQVPYEVAGEQSTHIAVYYNRLAVGSLDAPVAAASPGVAAGAVNNDGTANAAGAPASGGSTVTVLATGQGLMAGANVTGQVAQAPYAHPVMPISVKVGGITATILDASSQPGAVGTLQVKLQLPSILPSGGVPLELSVGSAAAPAITVYVK